MTNPHAQATPQSASGTLSLSELERRLGRLMREYLRSRSPAQARSVVQLIDRVRAHPGFEVDGAERCAWLHLSMQWRCLADHHSLDGA